jgi:hypothetical protein
LLIVIIGAVVAIAIVTAVVADLTTSDTWLGIVQKVATIIGIAGAAYIAYRRFLSGGGTLTARCELELSAAIVQYRSGHSRALVVTTCISNEGGVDLVLLGDPRPPVIEVLCLTDALVAEGESQKVFPWIKGDQLGGLPFRKPSGELDHDDLEPGSKIQSTVAIPVPVRERDPYRAFQIRFTIQARSANEADDGFVWTSDTVVFDVDPPAIAGTP